MVRPAAFIRQWIPRALVHAVFLVCVGSASAAQNPASSTCDLQTSERIVAVADVHGAHDRFVAILRAAGLIDDRDRWSGGRAILVQTGDVVDRGADSRKTLDLLRRLEGEASRAGGRVHALLGNHETMWMLGDLRDVSPGEYAAFRTDGSEELRERYYRVLRDRAATQAKTAGEAFVEETFRATFLKGTPLGFTELVLAFAPDGEYGGWLREHDTMVKINDIVFVHGGISPAVAGSGCAAINTTVRAELKAAPSADPQQLTTLLTFREDGPLWYRGLAQENESAFAPQVDAVLQKLNAGMIVVGHSVAAGGQMKTRFGGRVVQLDTGMLDGSFFPGGRASALEIRDGKLTAIYEDRREELGSVAKPATASQPVPAPPDSPAAVR
jgi:Calcineurin-like phosphoesterase